MNRSTIGKGIALGLLGTSVGLGVWSISGTPEGPHVDKSKNSIIIDKTEQGVETGMYIGGVYSADPIKWPTITVEQCPEQNSLLKECLTTTIQITTEQASQLAVGQTVIVEEILN